MLQLALKQRPEKRTCISLGCLFHLGFYCSKKWFWGHCRLLFFKPADSPIGISLMGNSGHFPWGKPAATKLLYPTYGACWMFWHFHNPPNSTMDMIFYMLTDVNACNCTWRVWGQRKRVCTESWLWEENPLPHQGIRFASGACWSDALPAELHPWYLLSLLSDRRVAVSFLWTSCCRLYVAHVIKSLIAGGFFSGVGSLWMVACQ